MKGIAEKIRDLIGKKSVNGWAEAHGLPPQTVHEWIKHDRMPRSAALKVLADATGVPVEWWKSGIGKAPVPQPLESPTTAPTAVNEDRMMYMARVATSDAPGYGSIINEELLDACYAACRKVHGDAFDAVSAPVQMGYAVDLYNLLVKISAQNGGLEQMKRLEIKGLVEQLNVFVMLGWARKFPPPEPSPWHF